MKIKELSIKEKQQLKAARYLIKVNPKRYYWERYYGYVYLYDCKGRYQHHERAVNSCVKQSLLGFVPLYGYSVTIH